MDLTVAELFAGVGGFRVGLNHITEIDSKTGSAVEDGDWDFVWANQYEPSTKSQEAFDCYVKRFGEEHSSNTDINKVDKLNIPDHNLLVGGFPCQDYSVARSLSNELGIAGKKGVLFRDIRDTLLAKNPPFILLENVDRLLKSPSTQRGRDFAVMLKTLDEIGYNVFWRVINAGDYGFPQRRRRVFIFGVRKNTKYNKNISKLNGSELIKSIIFNKNFPIKIDNRNLKKTDLSLYNDIVDVSDNFKDGKFCETGSMVDGLVEHVEFNPIKEPMYTLGDILNISSQYNPNDLSKYIIRDERLEKWKYLKGAKRIERVSKTGHTYIYSEGNMAFPDRLDLPARTMLTSESTMNRSSHVVYDSSINELRLLTEVEAEMIQLFPPNWTNTMSSRKRYFMMGNALVTGIISRIELDLKNIILNEPESDTNETVINQLNFFNVGTVRED